MKAQELPQVEPSPWCWKAVRCLSLLYGACVGCFGSFMWCGCWRHLYGNEEMYHGTGSTADRPFRVSGTDRDGIWAYRKEGSIDRMQRSDAVHMLQEDHAWKKARVCPDRRKLVALFLSLGLALVLSFVPSPAHKQAQQRHAIQQEAREKEKKSKSDGCLKTD